MAPSDVCQAWLDAYCMNVCPHASSHELVARFDAAKGHPESAWRCYALETLSADRERYVTGTTYCTRHKILQDELALCESKTRDTSDDDATISVAVDAAGGATASPPHLAATPCVFAGAEHDCVERADPLDEAAAASGPSVELVMAHCKESSHWLGDVQLGLRTAVPDAWLALHVYEKCGSKLETHWPRGGWARERRSWIQNKGEECYAYLSYITTWWKHLPEYVVFFQGDGVLNGERFRSKLQMWGAEVVATGMVDAWRSVNDHQYISVAPTQAACDAAALSNCFVHPEQHACMAALHRRHHPDDDAPNEALVWAMYTNAQFGVSVDRLRRKSLGAWNALLSEFDGEEHEQCYHVYGKKARPLRGTCALFEYMWPSLLGEPRVLPMAGTTMTGSYPRHLSQQKRAAEVPKQPLVPGS